MTPRLLVQKHLLRPSNPYVRFTKFRNLSYFHVMFIRINIIFVYFIYFPLAVSAECPDSLICGDKTNEIRKYIDNKEYK